MSRSSEHSSRRTKTWRIQTRSATPANVRLLGARAIAANPDHFPNLLSQPGLPSMTAHDTPPNTLYGHTVLLSSKMSRSSEHSSSALRGIPMRKRYSSLPLTFIICAIFVSGCVSLSPKAKQIHFVTNSQEISACERLGPVSIKTMKCVDPSTCMGAAAAKGRNEAAKLGATHLLQTYNGITLTHGVFDGFAYRCAANRVGVQRTEEVSSQPLGPKGCTKDIECKGDRICVSGECVFPRK